MITLPSDVKMDDNWDGRSQTPDGATVPNKQSKMDFAEHQRIVFTARHLIENLNYPEDVQNANRAKAALMLLKAAYTSNDGGVVYISKGIHQPYSDPHMQLRVVTDEVSHLFHLDVSADEIVTDDNGREHFQWRGVRFSARVKNGKPSWEKEQYDWAVWPEGVAVTRKTNKRNSISGPGLLQLNAKIAEEKARIAEQKARVAKQSEIDTERNRILASIKDKLGFEPENVNAKKKLFNGEQANFKTKNGKVQVCTLKGKIFTHNGGTLSV